MIRRLISFFTYRRELRAYQMALDAARGNHAAIRHIVAARRARLHAALGAGR